MNTYARFRLTSDPLCTAATGTAVDGEVEDYRVLIRTFDSGDLPDTGVGLGVGNYSTLASDNGARHEIVTGLFMGATVDAEGDGVSSVGADGDDLATTDDENGVTVSDLNLVATSTPVVRVNATNTTANAAEICGFIDFNGDGDFTDPGEAASVPVPVGSNNVQFNLNFGAVPQASANSTYARFRLSTALGCVHNGDKPNGEVEDYPVAIRILDWGDLPDTGAGVGTGNYNTLNTDNGAVHNIVTGLFMGASVDAEVNGQPNTSANGDDLALVPDDEDGVNAADLTIIAVTSPVVRVNATNTTGTNALLCGHIDYNANGSFADPGETGSVPVPTGSNNAVFTLNFGLVPASSATATYARFRLSTDANCAESGPATNGEVEDYPVVIRIFDLGDLPDSGAGVGVGNYNTVAADLGARHEIIPGIFMGAAVDAEGDGQPGAAADGDDLVTTDDEDGVTLRAGGYELGSPARVTVLATNTLASAATLCGFIDWNGDGDFTDASEATSLPVPSGSNNISLILNFGLAPLNAIASTYGRFRLSTGVGCSASGDAINGEVEDYVVTTTTNGALSLGNLVWEDLNNNGVFDSATEAGIDGIAVSLFEDTNQDCQPDGAALANQNTAGGGLYLFTDLVPGIYIVTITPPATYLGSSGTGLVYAPSGPYEPAGDPDNNLDNDDNGTQAGAVIKSCGIELLAKDEPITDADTDFNTNTTVDFGLVRNFDLALRKRLAATQSLVVNLGMTVNYEITVYNQGSIPATNVLITDYIPIGLTLNDAGWTSTGAQTATRLIAGPIAPGGNAVVSLALLVQGNAPRTAIRNFAEITEAQDDTGVVRPDKDSTPDGNPGNDGTPTDDETSNGNGDQDDQDFADVIVTGEIPAWSHLASLILMCFLLLATTRKGMRLASERK